MTDTIMRSLHPGAPFQFQCSMVVFREVPRLRTLFVKQGRRRVRRRVSISVYGVTCQITCVRGATVREVDAAITAARLRTGIESVQGTKVQAIDAQQPMVFIAKGAASYTDGI